MIPQDDVAAPVSLSLNPYTGSWTKAQAAHLLRRTIFGPTFEQIRDAVAAGMEATVNQLLVLPDVDPPLTYHPDEAVAPFGTTWVESVLPAGNVAATENARLLSMVGWVMERINTQPLTIREKMCLFWQNHFAAEFTFDSRASYNYINLIRTHALGNFRQFVKDMTIDPCMLLFLNGNSNNVYSPNENYARELLELYTIGKGPQVGPGDYTNYTEQDVLEGAKILTGWTVQGFGSTTLTTTSPLFYSVLHDGSTKTLSARFGNQAVAAAGENEYKNYIDIIFQQPAVATFICRKLYRWFVNYDLTPAVENTVITALAQTLIDNDYEILPVMEQLLKSEHFYDISMRGTIIKNPLEFMFSLLNSTHAVPDYGLAVNSEMYRNVYFLCATNGMNYLKPPSVGGWTAYYQAPAYTKLWANSSYIKLRFDLVGYLNYYGGITVGANKLGVNHFGLLNSLSLPSSAPDVIEDLVTVFCPKGLTTAKKLTLKAILTNGLPDFEWTLQYNDYLADPNNPTVSDPVKIRLALTLDRLFKMPEFQTI